MEEIEDYENRIQKLFIGMGFYILGTSTYIADSPRGFYALEVALRKDSVHG
jgi:hypothetical protein